MDALILWVAQGFGAGRIPLAPGTFGSVVGMGWFFLLVWTGRPGVFLAGLALGFFASVWFCGAAEKILRQTDPGSVVLDEIIAIPVCFAGWMAVLFFRHGYWPSPSFFLSIEKWPASIGIFLLFRIFDVAKPWPVRQSQRLPGGWGITVDDLLAAGYVNVVVLAVLAIKGG